MEWNFCISLSAFKRVRKYCTPKALLYWILLKYLQKYIFPFNNVSLLSPKWTETDYINLQFLCKICLLPTVLLMRIMRKRKIFRRVWHGWEEPDFPKCLMLLCEAEYMESTLTSRNCQHQILHWKVLRATEEGLIRWSLSQVLTYLDFQTIINLNLEPWCLLTRRGILQK